MIFLFLVSSEFRRSVESCLSFDLSCACFTKVGRFLLNPMNEKDVLL